MSLVKVVYLNPELGPPYTMRDAAEISVAEGWNHFFVQPDGSYKRPEWCGWENTQKMFHRNCRIRAGLYQKVQAVKGAQYAFSADVHFTSRNAGLAVVVGIDPYGGNDMLSEQMAWGPWWGETAPRDSPYRWDGRGWKTACVERVIAQNHEITLWCRAENLYPGDDLSTFWRGTSLYIHRSEPTAPDDQTILGLLIEIRNSVSNIEAHITGSQNGTTLSAHGPGRRG